MLKKFLEKKKLNAVQEEICAESTEMPHLVEYIYKNIPLQGLPVNSVGVFIEDACNLLGAMLTPGIFNVPVVIYRVSASNFNFFNYKLELIGGFSFSENGEKLQTFGKEFSAKSGFSSYKLMSLSFDYSATDSLIQKKFDNVQVFSTKVTH